MHLLSILQAPAINFTISLESKQVCLHPGVGVIGRCRSDEVPAAKCSEVPDLDDCFVDGHPLRDFLNWVRITCRRFTKTNLV